MALQENKIKTKKEKLWAALEKTTEILCITLSKEKRYAEKRVHDCVCVVFIFNVNELHFYTLRNKIHLQKLRSGDEPAEEAEYQHERTDMKEPLE